MSGSAGSYLRGVVPGGYPKLLTFAKGATTSLVVPTGRIYYLAWLAAYFNTDATAATREFRIGILLLNTANQYLLTQTGVTASLNRGYSYGIVSAGGATEPPQLANGTGKLLPIFAGQTLRVTLVNEQAGDAWAVEGVYYDTYGIAG